MESGSGSGSSTVFEDLFPWMMEKLGKEGFMEELHKGFRLLMDEEKGLITFDSLKRNSSLLMGLDFKCAMIDDDEMIREMLREGDLDGDGCLNLREFCVLMFRLSPALMSASANCLHQFFAKFN